MVATVARWVRHEAEPTKGSRFIATVVPTADEAAAREALAALRDEMPDATHHCSAWRIASPSIDRASDDGEPSGSAGRPILAQLQGRDLVNVAIIVTRYYGGTKLGVGGLVRAYGSAASEALDHAQIVPFVPMVRLQVTHGYPEGDDVERVLTRFEAVALHADYSSDVTRDFEVAIDRLDALTEALRDATRGRARVRRLDS